MNLLRDAEGRIRSPYVTGLFILVAVAFEGVLSLLLGFAGLLHFEDLDSPRVFFATFPTLVSGVGATLVCWLAFREPTGLNAASPLHLFGAGFLIGAVTLCVCCLVPALVGTTSLSLTPKSAGVVASAGLMQLLTLSPAGFGEELLLRGLGFNALRRGMGDVAAVAVSSVIFGGLHLFNPDATGLAALQVALVGAWFGALTVRTGSVWLAMGVHVAWNFFEGFVFGQPVSGNPPGTSLLIGRSGAVPTFWSGGAFGPEAAGWTAVVLVLALGLTLALDLRSTQTRRRGR